MSRREDPDGRAPIDVRDQFRPERDALTHLLAGFAPEAWSAPTVCEGWTVHDVATHILGDDVGRLARTRDGYAGLAPDADEDLPRFIDRINQEWVVAARRVSPTLLVDALRWTGAQIEALWRSLDPAAPSEPVSWAGPQIAPVWFDAARDFSEYWVHHQQIRDAVGAPTRVEYAGSVIDTFLRALPHTLRHVGEPGDVLRFEVTGEAGGTWTVVRGAEGWQPDAGGDPPSAEVSMDVDTCWRLCSRMLDPQEARGRARTRGARHLSEAALRIVAIIHPG